MIVDIKLTYFCFSEPASGCKHDDGDDEVEEEEMEETVDETCQSYE